MTEQTAVYFNPWDPAFRDNPYPHYGALLAGPPHIIDFPPVKVALVALYADVTRVLRDHATFSNVGPPPPPKAYQKSREISLRRRLSRRGEFANSSRAFGRLLLNDIEQSDSATNHVKSILDAANTWSNRLRSVAETATALELLACRCAEPRRLKGTGFVLNRESRAQISS